VTRTNYSDAKRNLLVLHDFSPGRLAVLVVRYKSVHPKLCVVIYLQNGKRNRLLTGSYAVATFSTLYRIAREEPYCRSAMQWSQPAERATFGHPGPATPGNVGRIRQNADVGQTRSGTPVHDIYRSYEAFKNLCTGG
jgi:hypothetical protein